MNQLTILEKEGLNKLPENLKPFAIARMGRKCGDIPRAELDQALYLIIVNAFKERGELSVTTKMLTFQRDELSAEILCSKKFKSLTIAEVENAFFNGIRKQYGDYFGLCKATYHLFLNSYFKAEERAESMKKYLELLEPTTKELSEEQKDKIIEDGIKSAFEEYKQSGHLPVISWVYYDYLTEKKGVVIATKEEKISVAQQAETEYVNEIKTKRSQGLLRTSAYESIIASLSTNPTLKNNMKKIALQRYWNKLLNQK